MSPLNPPASGKCDDKVCNIVQRADDKEEIISNRMIEYAEKTEPLLKAYQERGVVLDFEVKKGVQDYPELLSLI